MQELYWIAKYNDGSELRQFEENPTGFSFEENKYADIDRERLCKFIMVDSKTKKPVYALYLRDGQKLIFRRRTFKRLGSPDVVIFLVGYYITFLTNSGVRNHFVINYLHPDGSISLDGARDNLQLVKEEK